MDIFNVMNTIYSFFHFTYPFEIKLNPVDIIVIYVLQTRTFYTS
jgi:hypothetical protein